MVIRSFLNTPVYIGKADQTSRRRAVPVLALCAVVFVMGQAQTVKTNQTKKEEENEDIEIQDGRGMFRLGHAGFLGDRLC